MQFARFLVPLLLGTVVACGEDSADNSTTPTGSVAGSTSAPVNTGTPGNMGVPAATAMSPNSAGSMSPNSGMAMPTTNPAVTGEGGTTGMTGGEGGAPPGAGGTGAGSTNTGGVGVAGAAPTMDEPEPNAAGGASPGEGGSSGMQNEAGGAMGIGGMMGDPAPQTGEALFALYCSACHGMDAMGGPAGPNVRYSDSGLTHFLVTEGRTTMDYPAPMVPLEISDEDVDLIVEYLWSFPKPTTGQELFVQICANCHGADGAGGPTGRHVTGEAGKAQELVRNGHRGAYDDRREFMPSYDQSQITDQELQLIIQFIQTL